MKISQINQTCQICGKQGPGVNLIKADLLRPDIVNIIKHSHPEWTPDGFICEEDLSRFRNEYIRSIVEAEKGELSDLENEVLENMARHEILSTQVDQEYESQLTFGQHLSDRIAQFGGSWVFIILFGCMMTFWIIVNSVAFVSKPFDPYPYIFLNLILSCIAAIQAPIIMMSQNRQEAKDRARIAHDYQVNLKAELEIRQLHQKVDHLLSNQWKRLIEIQEVQLEMLSEMRGQGIKSKPVESGGSDTKKYKKV